MQENNVKIGPWPAQPSVNTAGGGGGDGGSFGDMESRVKTLETHIEYVRRDVGEMRQDIRDLRKESARDFRIIFGALIATALGLAGLMAKGFHWL